MPARGSKSKGVYISGAAVDSHPMCLRCGKNKERFLGATVNIPFTQPNRLFNPDIYICQLSNIACKDCMDDLSKVFLKWWTWLPASKP